MLTLRAVRALQSADVILIDDLVAPAILDFARREAKKMMVGKTGFAPSCRQDEINSLMVSLAKAGRRVVRLKGGDPMIFGRAGEEIAACRKARIPVEVVPGISAAQGAASRLGVSLTHRNLARRIQYVTAHGADGKLPSDIDWASLADPVTTTVVYMPKRALAELAATAQARGPFARHAGGRRGRGDAAGSGGHRRNDRRHRHAARSGGAGASGADHDRPRAGAGRQGSAAARRDLVYFDTSPAASITGFHRVVSAAMNLSNSSIDIGSVIMPSR